MQELLANPVFMWAVGMGGFLLFLWGIRAPLKFLYRTIIRTHEFLEQWFGEPGKQPGIPERLAQLETVTSQQSFTLGELRHELKPNSGSSMNDRLTRVEKILNPDAPDNH